ncbi:MAG: efflux RND transporter periplasmic adaptor subunit [Deltaproteobacteria bacterium]
MSSFFSAHRILSLVVLAAAAGWVGTGEFAAVGSGEAATTEEAEATTPVETKPLLRTVGAVVPVFIDHAREIRLSGATEADKDVVLAARASGIVAKLNVKQGAEVTANDLVVELEGPEANAAVATAKAGLAQATQQLDVGEKLFANGSLPELEITSRRANKAAAEAQLAQANAALDRLLLRAPFSGVVDSVAVEPGEWVQAGTPITTILSLNPILVKAEISERDISNVKVGSKALVRLVDGTEMEGTIRHLSHQASKDTRTFVAEVALPNADRAISAGMTAEVTLYAEPIPAIVVPRSVITLSENGEIGLRVVGADNLAQFQRVDLIDDTPDGIVVSGVPKNVRIIVAGQDLVRNGDEVIVTEQAAAELIQ